MDLCSSGHDEVCFDGRVCPLCEKITEYEVLETTNSDQEKRIDELEDDILTKDEKISNLEDEIQSLTQELGEYTK